VSRYAGAVLEQLSRVFNQGTVVGLTEGKLLERFVAVGDEAAFAALVARHGLCYLEGLTHEEAAEQLRWPVGTVRSRMARARDLLRRRLVRRGFTADGAALSTALARQAVPVTLIDSEAGEKLAGQEEGWTVELLIKDQPTSETAKPS
jgi:hypothetical protein